MTYSSREYILPLEIRNVSRRFGALAAIDNVALSIFNISTAFRVPVLTLPGMRRRRMSAGIPGRKLGGRSHGLRSSRGAQPGVLRLNETDDLPESQRIHQGRHAHGAGNPRAKTPKQPFNQSTDQRA